MTRALMIQGAGSDVGKSLVVAGLARAAPGRGRTVLPFKPQNMSNNAAVTIDGGEIGRVQALQALAAGAEPHTDMNPVLMKPETDAGAPRGRRAAHRHEPGAAEAGDRCGLAGDRAGQARRDPARARLCGAEALA